MSQFFSVAKAVMREITKKPLPQKLNSDSSNFVQWLRFANAGMLHPGNVECIEYAMKHLRSEAPMVEIGSFCGLSTNVITHFKRKYGLKNRLHTCDRWVFEGADANGMLGDSATISHADYREFVKKTYIRNVSMFSACDLPWTVEMFSDEFFSAWGAAEKCEDILGRTAKLGGPIGFCYIDGDHSYAQARRDFENCDKYLEPSGYILFDDSADFSGWEVCRVVREIRRSKKYRLLAKNPNYFFQKL